jgi:hypothetical protein
LDNKEFWWRQRAKEEWLKYGDRNTKYYHACATSKNRRNHVAVISDVRGQTWNTHKEVGTTFVNYFTQLFTTGPVREMEPCLQPTKHRVTEEMNRELVQPFTAEEVHVALFQMAPLNAPRPDGLNALFFQKNWHILGDEVCGVIIDILNSRMMSHALNHTHIALISKIKKPNECNRV